MNRLNYFCHYLAQWLYESEWHFTTLLATCIHSVKQLPDDVDVVINQLLLTCPEKPAQQTIATFLSNNAVVCAWFRCLPQRPEIARYSLHTCDMPAFVSDSLPDLHNGDDLAAWLGVSSGELDWLADLWRHDETAPACIKHYHYSLAPKRHGGSRLIESPKGLLKQLQRKINDHIISCMPINDAAHGFRKGRSCNSHAALHVGKKYLMHFDISDCFQSIQWGQVYQAFSALGYTPAVAKYLTGICSHQCYMHSSELFQQLDAGVKERLKQRHLPQGAPSSPALSNAVLNRLDRRFTGLAKSTALTYSRYADDFVFSGNQNRDWQSFGALIGSICLEEGFRLNYRKTRLVLPHQKQKVTGIVVNEKLNIDRRYYDRLKAVLTNCIRYGLESQNRSGHQNFKLYLRGCIQHVKSLNQNKGAKLELLFNQIN